MLCELSGRLVESLTLKSFMHFIPSRLDACIRDQTIRSSVLDQNSEWQNRYPAGFPGYDYVKPPRDSVGAIADALLYTYEAYWNVLARADNGRRAYRAALGSRTGLPSDDQFLLSQEDASSNAYAAHIREWGLELSANFSSRLEEAGRVPDAASDTQQFWGPTKEGTLARGVGLMFSGSSGFNPKLPGRMDLGMFTYSELREFYLKCGFIVNVDLETVILAAFGPEFSFEGVVVNFGEYPFLFIGSVKTAHIDGEIYVCADWSGVFSDGKHCFVGSIDTKEEPGLKRRSLWVPGADFPFGYGREKTAERERLRISVNGIWHHVFEKYDARVLGEENTEEQNPLL